jgi:hypothetical protein
MFERFRSHLRDVSENSQVFGSSDFENLVRDGRIPDFWDGEDKVTVVLPPEGVRPGDDYELKAGGKIEYFAPNGGPSKGLASFHEVSLREGSRLKKIKSGVLEEQGLINS